MSEKLSLKSLDARLTEWEELTKGLNDELATLQAESTEQLERTSARFDAVRADLDSALSGIAKKLEKANHEVAYIAHLARRHEEILNELTQDLFCSKCFTWLYAIGFVLMSLFLLWRL